MVMLCIVGGVLLLLGFTHLAVRRQVDDPQQEDNPPLAAAMALIVVGVAAILFPLTPWFEDIGPSNATLVLLSVLGCLLILFGIIVLFARRGQPLLTVYRIRVPLAVVPILIGVALLAFPYTPLYSGPREQASASFTMPTPKSKISAGEEFDVAGEIRGLPGDATLWLLITSPEEPNKNFFYSAYQPLVVSDGRFSDTDSFGATAIGKKLYVAVQANRECDKNLRDTVIDPANSDRIIRALPRSCLMIGTLEFQIVN